MATQNNLNRVKGLIATSGIELLTFGTPNGHKASIMLEELKEAYNMSYTWQSVPIMDNVQKEPWYTKLNPNGKIPTIVDHDRGGFAVMEGSGEPAVSVMYSSKAVRLTGSSYSRVFDASL